MPLYMTQFACTPEAWSALTRTPEDRAAAVRALLESTGGRMVAFYYSFGEYDGLVIYESPDESAVAANMIAVGASGRFKATRTTPLLSSEDAMKAMRKAGEISYQRPGG